jgi:replicative DNA helicase
LPGQIACVLAKTGQGKTAFLAQLCHNISAWQSPLGDRVGPATPTLVLSLEQTKAEFVNRLDRISKIYNPWATPEELERWYCNLRICDENQIPPKDVLHLIEEFVDEVGTAPKVIVLDYLGYWARAFKGKSRYEQVSEAIMELKRIAKTSGAVVLTAHQVSRSGKRGLRLELDDARDSGVIEETVDFAFGLYRPHEAEQDDTDAALYERSEVYLEVLKSRHGNVGRKTVLQWAPYSLAMLAKGDMDRRVAAEWTLYDLQSSYDEVVGYHQSGEGKSGSLF